MAKTIDLIELSYSEWEVSDLVSGTLSGDTAAFGQLVERFQRMAFSYAFRHLQDQMEAQDAVQEAFWEAYQSLSSLRTPEAFPGWFKRIVMKQTNRQIRSRRMIIPFSDPVDDEKLWLDHLNDPFEIFHRSAHSETVQNAIQSLPDNQRQVILLFYLNNYSQKEISSLIQIPVSTIKKRLHDARINLKRQFKLMNIEKNATSDQERKSHIVAFYIALRAKDYPTIKKYLRSTPDLVHVLSEWAVASDTYYWPLGATPLGWAAGVGDVELSQILLDHGAAVDGLDTEPLAPLHHAILMEQDATIELLLSAGADINRQAQNRLSALHFAVMRQNAPLVHSLIEAGANINLEDQDGNLPSNWAKAKKIHQLADVLNFAPKKEVNTELKATQRTVPNYPGLLGRTINALGQALDKRPLHVSDTALIPHYTHSLLETGVKMIDLCMPIKRGGYAGVFTSLSGVGRIMIQAHLMYNMAMNGGYVVYIGIEEGENTAEALKMELRAESNIPQRMLNEQFVFLFEQEDASPPTKQMLAETARAIAESLCGNGHEVLVVVGQAATQIEGLVDYMRSRPFITPRCAITTLFDGDHTIGLEPPCLKNLDTVLTFSYERAFAGLWPALDPLSSQISPTWHAQLPERNRQLCDKSHRLLLRYAGLRYQFNKRGEAGLFYLADFDQEKLNAVRGQRLETFLTQMLPVNEPITGRMGQTVSLDETLSMAEAVFGGR